MEFNIIKKKQPHEVWSKTCLYFCKYEYFETIEECKQNIGQTECDNDVKLFLEKQS